MSAPAHRGVLVKLALVALIWAATFAAGRVAVAEMAPETVGVWRYVIASVALSIALVAREGAPPRLTWRQGAGVALLGVTGVFVYNLLFLYGIRTVPASRAALIVALNPVFTALGAWLFFHDRMTPVKLLGSALALAGAATVISHGDLLALLAGDMGSGEALLLGCSFSWVAYTLLGKRVMAGLSPLAATAYASVAGTLMLVAVAVQAGALTPPVASTAAWGSIVFLGLVATGVAFVWYYEGVKAIGPARAGVFINLVPVMAVVFGVALLGETLDAATAIGGAITVAGVWLLNRTGERGPAAAKRAPGLENSRCA